MPYLKMIEQEVKEGALVFVRGCLTHFDMPGGVVGYYHDESRDLLGIITDITNDMVTIDVRAPRYMDVYHDVDSSEFTVVDSETSEEDAHKAIDAFNQALGVGYPPKKNWFQKILSRHRHKREMRKIRNMALSATRA